MCYIDMEWLGRKGFWGPSLNHLLRVYWGMGIEGASPQHPHTRVKETTAAAGR